MAGYVFHSLSREGYRWKRQRPGRPLIVVRRPASVESLRVWAYIRPATKSVPVWLQWQPVTTRPFPVWHTAAQTKEDANGKAVMDFTPQDSGVYNIRVAVGGSAAAPQYMAILKSFVLVYPDTPAVQASADLLQLDKELCYTIADEFKRLMVIEPPAMAYVGDVWSTTYKKSECDQEPFASALREGFMDATVSYVIDRFTDGVAEKAWGPEFDRILNLAQIRDPFTRTTLKSLWNN